MSVPLTADARWTSEHQPYIALVIPPSGFLLDERVFPTLGILKVAAALRQAGHDVEVVDLAGQTDMRRAAIALANRFQPPYAIGITATMPQMPAAARFAATVREMRPDIRLILGGPHATLLRSSVRQEVERGVEDRATRAFAELYQRFDTVVAGDGERAVLQAIRPNAPPLIDADAVESPLFLTKADLLEAPPPARDLIDLESYHYTIDGHKTTSLIAQLGCPFGCTFCGGRRSPFLRRVRTRTADQVLDEIWRLHHVYGYTGFMFLDDELNVNREFPTLLYGLVRLQDELGVEFRLRGLLKAELLTAPMADAMARAGFSQVLVGFESGSPRILTNIQKRATVDDNTRCVEYLRAAGIRVKALMSFGHAGESDETIDATENWLREIEPDDFDATIITVYPGTPYHDDARPVSDHYVYTAANGDRLYQAPVDHLQDVNFYKGVPGSYQSFVWTDALSREALVARRDQVEADVRAALDVPWPSDAAAVHYEHSMGAR